MGAVCSSEPSPARKGAAASETSARRLVPANSFHQWQEEPDSVQPEPALLAFGRLFLEEAIFLCDVGLHVYLVSVVPGGTVAHYVATATFVAVVALQLLVSYAAVVWHTMRIPGQTKPRCGRSEKTGQLHCAGVELSCAPTAKARQRGRTALALLVLLGPPSVLVLDLLVLLRTLGLARCIFVDSYPDLDAAIAAYRPARLSLFAATESLIGGALVATVLSSHALFRQGFHNAMVLDALRVDASVDPKALGASLACSVAQVLLHVARPLVVAARRRLSFKQHALELGGSAPLGEARLGLARAVWLSQMPAGAELDALVAAIAAGRSVGEVRVQEMAPLEVGSWPMRPSTSAVRLLTAMLRGDRRIILLDCEKRDLNAAHGEALASALRVNSTLLELHCAKNALGDVGAVALAGALSVNHALQVLDLSVNSISDEGALALAGAITTNYGCALRALGLRQNLITDVGAVAIAQALRTDGVRLEALRLDRNLIGDEGGVALADAMLRGAPLKELQLNGNAKLADAALGKLAEAVRASRKLEVLDLSGTDMPVRAAQRIASAAAGSRTLHTLRLGANPRIGAGGIGSTLGQAVNAPACALVELELSMANLPPADMASLARALERNGTLEIVDLSGNRTGAGFAALLAKALEANQRLTTLRLEQCYIGDGAGAVFAALRTHGTLRTLHLSSSPLPPRALEELGTTLKGDQSLTTGLRELHLDDVGLGNPGAKLVARALEKNRALAELTARLNGIGDVGARSFAEMLEGRNETLRELDLGSNEIADLGASALAKALGKNAALTKLALDSNLVRERGAEALASALANDAPALSTLLIESSELSAGAAQSLGVAVRTRSTFVYVDAVHERSTQTQLTRLESRAEVTATQRRQGRRRSAAVNMTWNEAAEDYRLRAAEEARPAGEDSDIDDDDAGGSGRREGRR